MNKDILYIEVDDEITSVIDKIEASRGKVVALVLPKHASILSSTVNMKLLKKAEEASKKNLVIITSDPSLMTLAGMARLHVAKSLKSKPVMPALPKNEASDIEFSNDEAATVQTKEAANSDTPEQDTDEVIQLDNTLKTPKQKPALGPKNKKLAVPDFTSFRLKVFLLSAFLIGLAVFGVYAVIYAPKATIAIKTEVSTVETGIKVTAATSAKELNKEQLLMPATANEVTKKDSEKSPATGKKDVGEKATGSMTVINCSDNDIDVPAGTTFSNSGFAFSLDETVNVPASDFFSNGNCKSNGKTTTTVTAVQAGGDSNLSSGRTYVSSIGSTLTGVGGAMGGGTSKIITVLTASDIELAKGRLAGKSKASAITEIKTNAEQDGKLLLEDTISETAPKFTYSAAVDAEVAEVTVTSEVTYTMLSVASSDLQSLIEASITEKITDAKQIILDNGLSSKTTQLVEKKSAGEQSLTVSVIATVGPDIDKASIASEMAGKSRGEILQLLSQRTGIKDVTVSYSPFWVVSTPKKASKINVTVEQVTAEK